MSDIGLTLVNADGGGLPSFDISIADGDAVADDGLATAVFLSIFCDARAPRKQLPVAEIDPRGWWADTFAENDGDSTGSLLWLHARQKNTRTVRAQIADAIRASLTWLIEDGVASDVFVSHERFGISGAAFRVEVVRLDGTAWDTAWNTTIGD